MSQWVRGARAVFFDAVGTLLFPAPAAPDVYAGAARRRGVECGPADILARFATAFRAEEAADRAAGWVTSEEREVARWRRIVAETLPGVPDPDGCFRELYDHFADPANWAVSPDAAAVFAALQSRGIAVGLGSNYDARLCRVLDGHPGLDALRERVVVSATVGHRKPAAAFFDEVTRLAGCDRGAIVFVGDDVGNDYAGATAAGMRAVLLDPGGRFPEVERRIERLTELNP